MGSTTLSTNTSRCSAQFLLFLPCQLWLKVIDFHVILATELQSLHIVLLNQLMGLQNLLTLLQNQLDTLHLLTPLQQNPLISNSCHSNSPSCRPLPPLPNLCEFDHCTKIIPGQWTHGHHEKGPGCLPSSS